MQPKGPKTKRTSLYSKFKQWCNRHSVPFILFPILAFAIIAIAALIIGGTIAGWDIVGFLQSPTAVLIYVILVIVAFGVLYYRIMKDR